MLLFTKNTPWEASNNLTLSDSHKLPLFDKCEIIAEKGDKWNIGNGSIGNRRSSVIEVGFVGSSVPTCGRPTLTSWGLMNRHCPLLISI